MQQSRVNLFHGRIFDPENDAVARNMIFQLHLIQLVEIQLLAIKL